MQRENGSAPPTAVLAGVLGGVAAALLIGGSALLYSYRRRRTNAAVEAAGPTFKVPDVGHRNRMQVAEPSGAAQSQRAATARAPQRPAPILHHGCSRGNLAQQVGAVSARSPQEDVEDAKQPTGYVI